MPSRTSIGRCAPDLSVETLRSPFLRSIKSGVTTRVIGVDIGTNAVRAAELRPSRHGGRPRLTGFGQVALPPGAVVEGEIVDPAAVASALKRLWRDAGFGRGAVRVGLGSARVIVRVVELAPTAPSDPRSAIGLQLADYVPLHPDDTVFGVQPLPASPVDAGPGERRLLLAATHRDALVPLQAALAAAGLGRAEIDVVPAALARCLTVMPDGPQEPGGSPAEAIVSIGAGTMVVVVVRAGVPVYCRTITSVAAGSVTERIASGMGLELEPAERLKRAGALVPQPPDVARARLAAMGIERELLAEVRDSLAFYASQPDAAPIERVLLTGGGSLLVGLKPRLEALIEAPVVMAEPLMGVVVSDIGFAAHELPRLTPYLPVAVGLALGGFGTAERIDLTPPAAPRAPRARSTVLAAAVAVTLIGVGGVSYVRRGSELSDRRADADAAQAELAAATALALPDASTAAGLGPRSDTVASLLLAITATDVDWPSVTAELDGRSAGVGVRVSALQGAASPPVIPVAPAVEGAAAPPPPAFATLNLTGAAPDLPTVAAWIDAVEASPLVASVWVPTTSRMEVEGQPPSVQFSAEVTLTTDARVVRAFVPKETP